MTVGYKKLLMYENQCYRGYRDWKVRGTAEDWHPIRDPSKKSRKALPALMLSCVIISSVCPTGARFETASAYLMPSDVRTVHSDTAIVHGSYALTQTKRK